MPQDASESVYATEGYNASVRNLTAPSLSDDNVFGDDGAVSQLAVTSGSVTAGYVASLNVPVGASTAATQTNRGEGGRPRDRDSTPQ